jgi:hypothetical protein
MRLVFAGDFALASGSAGSKAILGHKRPFLPLINCFGTDSYVIANLEGALTTKPEGKPFKWVNLKMDPEIAKYISDVNIFSLSNNHLGDYDHSGATETIGTLTKHGISYTGLGDSLKKAIDPCVHKIDDWKVAISCLCCLTTNSEFIATHTEPGVAPISMETIKQAVLMSKAKADFCVLYLHWGCEWVHDPAPDQLRLARHAIDCGADAVIGCHSHTIQSYEQYKGKWIFYGLGNYCFDAGEALAPNSDGTFEKIPLVLNSENRESLVVSFELKKDNQGRANLALDRIQPFVYDETFLPHPCREEDLSFDLQAANSRLDAFTKTHKSFLKSRSEVEFRTLIRNGVVAYWYMSESIANFRPTQERLLISKRLRRILQKLKTLTNKLLKKIV